MKEKNRRFLERYISTKECTAKDKKRFCDQEIYLFVMTLKKYRYEYVELERKNGKTTENDIIYYERVLDYVRTELGENSLIYKAVLNRLDYLKEERTILKKLQ